MAENADGDCSSRAWLTGTATSNLDFDRKGAIGTGPNPVDLDGDGSTSDGWTATRNDWNAPEYDGAGTALRDGAPPPYTPGMARSGSADEEVLRDRRLALSAAQLTSRLSAKGILVTDLLLGLEDGIGGVRFGPRGFRVSLGLRLAFEGLGSRRDLPQTPGGRPLLRWGVEGDVSYFVTETGEVWSQDAVADPVPLRRAPDPLAFCAQQRWPLGPSLAALAALLQRA